MTTTKRRSKNWHHGEQWPRSRALRVQEIPPVLSGLLRGRPINLYKRARLPPARRRPIHQHPWLKQSKTMGAGVWIARYEKPAQTRIEARHPNRHCSEYHTLASRNTAPRCLGRCVIATALPAQLRTFRSREFLFHCMVSRHFRHTCALNDAGDSPDLAALS